MDNPGHGSWSQAWQDYYIYNNFFKGKREGIYLDIGTYDPWDMSNSAFFELCLDWYGICVESQTDRVPIIQGERKCKVMNHCIVGPSLAGKYYPFKGMNVDFNSPKTFVQFFSFFSFFLFFSFFFPSFSLFFFSFFRPTFPRQKNKLKKMKGSVGNGSERVLPFGNNR